MSTKLEDGDEDMCAGTEIIYNPNTKGRNFFQKQVINRAQKQHLM